MTDEEWARLDFLLAVDRGAGGRPADRRRLWDAIFWIACSTLPWRALPPGLGSAEAAHRLLRRAARARQLRRLMVAVSDLGKGVLESLRWRISRAARRVAKLMPLADVLLADRLGLSDLLPCRPAQLPRPELLPELAALGRLLRVPGLHDILIPLIRDRLRQAGGDLGAWRRTA